MLRIALYLNQFFGQLGSEEMADAPPRLLTEPVGPGRALVGLLASNESFVGTLVCGDSYFADHAEQAAQECLELLRPLQPDLLIAGPAFNAGRYGVACGTVCEIASRELQATVVSGMYAENPAVELYRRQVVIARTGVSAATMRETLRTMLGLARKLHTGEQLAAPDVDNYFPQGRAFIRMADKPAAERAIDMLLSKLRGEPYETEVALPSFGHTAAPAPLADLRDKLVALVTDGGLVPAGNPDNIESFAATRWGTYNIADTDHLDPKDYEVSHGGYDNRYVRQDPHRLVPLDAARQLERSGQIGRLFDKFVSTTGLSNPIDNSRRLGREIAEYLRQQGVQAVILTST
jgi:glycine reductase complex component B subunit gamma